MRSAIAFLLLFAALGAALAASLLLEEPRPEWLEFKDGPNVYRELTSAGLTTRDGLLGPDGKPAGDFVIVADETVSTPKREEGMFRSYAAAERFFGRELRLP